MGVRMVGDVQDPGTLNRVDCNLRLKVHVSNTRQYRTFLPLLSASTLPGIVWSHASTSTLVVRSNLRLGENSEYPDHRQSLTTVWLFAVNDCSLCLR